MIKKYEEFSLGKKLLILDKIKDRLEFQNYAHFLCSHFTAITTTCLVSFVSERNIRMHNQFPEFYEMIMKVGKLYNPTHTFTDPWDIRGKFIRRYWLAKLEKSLITHTKVVYKRTSFLKLLEWYHRNKG